MKVTLRIWQLDAFFPKSVEDCEIQITFQTGGRLQLLDRPDTKFKIERAFPEVKKDYFRAGVGKDIPMTPRNAKDNVADNRGIAFIGNAHRKRDSDQPVIGGPVGNTLIDELGVRNNDDYVVVGPDPGAPSSQRHDIPECVAHFDSIPKLDGLLHQKNQSGDEVADNRLKAEAYTDAKRPPTTTRLLRLRPADSRPIISPRINTK